MKRLALLLPLVLTSCSGPNPDVCWSKYDFPDRYPHGFPDNLAEYRDASKACVEHWAARLSLGRDRPDFIARAALTACRSAIDATAFAAIRERIDFDANAWRSELTETAIYRSVQQRAGNCGVPDLGKDPLSNDKPPSGSAPSLKAPPPHTQ